MLQNPYKLSCSSNSSDKTDDNTDTIPDSKKDSLAQNLDEKDKNTTFYLSDKDKNTPTKSDKIRKNSNLGTDKSSKQIFNLKVWIGLLVFSNFSFIVLALVFAYLAFSFGLPTSYFEPKNEIDRYIRQYSIQDYPTPEDLREGELKGLVSSLKDPFSVYLSKNENKTFDDALNQRYVGVGIRLDDKVPGVISVKEVFKNSPAAGVGLMVGDILQAVDGQSILKEDSNSVIKKIRGEEGTKVNLEVLRGQQFLKFELVRQKVSADLVTLDMQTYADKNIAVIKISSFGEAMDAKFSEITRQIKQNPQIKNLIIDVRGNGGGILGETQEVASYFLATNSLVVLEKDKGEGKKLYTTAKADSLQNYPLIVLIDGDSASASEILAGSLRDNRNVKLVGQTSYGKGTVQRLFPISNGGVLKLTIAEWFTPKGTPIDKKGLTPDVIVNPVNDSLEEAIKSF